MFLRTTIDRVLVAMATRPSWSSGVQRLLEYSCWQTWPHLFDVSTDTRDQSDEGTSAPSEERLPSRSINNHGSITGSHRKTKVLLFTHLFISRPDPNLLDFTGKSGTMFFSWSQQAGTTIPMSLSSYSDARSEGGNHWGRKRKMRQKSGSPTAQSLAYASC